VAPPVEPKPTAEIVAPAAKLDDATVIAKSHAFFDAIDKLDLAGATAPLGSSFVFFEEAGLADRAAIGKIVQGRIDRHAALRTRTWSDEHVFTTDSSAIFIADAIEHLPAEGARPVEDFEGYNTLVWVREGAEWRIAEWQWARGGIDAERDRWNSTFRAGVTFNHKPNQLLVDTLQGKKPGRALDLLMGQGRNALYEASQGWKVTGVDISDVGIRLAKEEAARQKLQLEVIDADVDKWDLGTNKWDLVTMIYAGDDAKLVERVKPSLKQGGLFVFEYFLADSDAAKASAGGGKTGPLAPLFQDGFKILRDEVVEDTADYGLGKRKLVRFVAQKL
jgi:SAM-dependent methyltransferase